MTAEPSPPSANELFDQLVIAYYRAWFRFHPRVAMEAGMQDYAHLLPSLDDDSFGALLGLNEKLLNSLEELSESALDSKHLLNYRLLRASAYWENHSLLQGRALCPDPYHFLPFKAIKQLELYPVEEFSQMLLKLLTMIPEHLRAARMLLSRKADVVPRLSVEIALQALKAGQAYLHELPARPAVINSLAQSSELASYLEPVQHALRDYEHFLRVELLPSAKGEWAVGSEFYQQVLISGHLLPVGLDRIKRLLNHHFDRTRADLQRLSLELCGTGDFVLAAERLRQGETDVADPQSSYRDHLFAAHQFLRDNEMISLPGEGMPKIRYIPDVLRYEVPCSVYHSLASWGGNRTGICWIDENEPNGGAASVLAIAHEAVRCGWPGLHLQEMLAKRNSAARGLIRRSKRSPLFSMGWALYAEQLMFEKGFFSGAKHRFWMLLQRLWVIKQAQLDLAVHCEDLPLTEAVEQLKANGLSERQIKTRFLCYTRSPAALLVPVLGWALINEMRDHYLRTERSFSDLNAFHDRLHSVGPLPLPLVARHVFGDAFWEQVLEQVFV